MKTREGFVSNSSTTSFICCVCGETVVEHDSVSYEDLDMWRCDDESDDDDCGSGHLMCTEHRLPDGSCPVCTFKVYAINELGQYFKKTTSYTEDEAFAAVKIMNKRRRKLHYGEYVEYVLGKMNKNDEAILAELHDKFPTYKDFKDFLLGSR